MKAQRLGIILTAINLLLLVFTLPHARAAAVQEVAPMLRGRGLEIVDNNGKVRAQIILLPRVAGPDGKVPPDGILFRLIDPNGRPGIKIGTSEDGSGMSLAGDSRKRDWAGVQILADTVSVIKLTNRNGRVQVIQP